MNTQYIMTRFQLSPITKPVQLKDIQKKRASAVMLPLIDINNTAHILLCKRPTYLHHHPGEICLPGGKFEPSDKCLRTTALRELKEELNIAPSKVNVIGNLAQYPTLTGFNISPFVGILDSTTTWQNDYNEVQASFLLPIDELSKERNWQPLVFQRFGEKITLQGYQTHHGLLWGATASIIKNFTKQLALAV